MCFMTAIRCKDALSALSALSESDLVFLYILFMIYGNVLGWHISIRSLSATLFPWRIPPFFGRHRYSLAPSLELECEYKYSRSYHIVLLPPSLQRVLFFGSVSLLFSFLLSAGSTSHFSLFLVWKKFRHFVASL